MSFLIPEELNLTLCRKKVNSARKTMISGTNITAEHFLPQLSKRRNRNPFTRDIEGSLDRKTRTEVKRSKERKRMRVQNMQLYNNPNTRIKRTVKKFMMFKIHNDFRQRRLSIEEGKKLKETNCIRFPFVLQVTQESQLILLQFCSCCILLPHHLCHGSHVCYFLPLFCQKT